MKKLRLIIFYVLLLGITLGVVYSSTEKFWEDFEAAKRSGLPRTAIEHLEEILKKTKEANKEGEWIRALCEKIVIEATIQGNKPEEKVMRLKKEFETAEPKTKALLQTVLAQWYWHYYKRNSYRFVKRTATEDMTDKDFTTWDLRKIFHEIDSLYQDVLLQKEILVTIPVEHYLDFLMPGNTPINYRPTLYDFVAHEALNFYTASEQGFLKPEDAFTIDANSDAFGLTDDFIRYQPITTDTASALLKALRIYQSLTIYHKQNENYNALVDLELHRLRFLKNTAFGEEKDMIYIKRLDALLEKYPDIELSSLVSYHLANMWSEKGELVKAYDIAKHGYNRFPDSPGGESCKTLMAFITKKALSVMVEKCIPRGPSKMCITYKNFTKLYVRVYKVEWDDFIRKTGMYLYRQSAEEIEAMLAQTAFSEWEIDMQATVDYKRRAIEVDIPELPQGFYWIYVSWQKDFRSSTMVQRNWFWVCNLTMVTKSRRGVVEGLVLDAVTGEPIEGVKVTQIIEHRKDKQTWYDFGESTSTDADGWYRFKPGHGATLNCMLCIEKGDDKYLSENRFYATSRVFSKTKPNTHTFLFTDRALYRPGQTIYFKGICVRTDHAEKDYQIIANEKVTIVYNDVNGKEVDKATFTTNEYGSFSGFFHTPIDRLNGRMSLSADDPRGSTYIRVEEYKRPKFMVDIVSPSEEFHLGQKIKVLGKAVAYTGAPINNAKVKYTVVRKAHFPYWWSWYYSYRGSTSQQIKHGTLITKDDGTFTIEFTAKPDVKISPADEPCFTFMIHADVTSPEGETRSGEQQIVLGYTAVKVIVQTDVQPVHNEKFSLVIATQTLNDVSVSGEVLVQIFKLKEPQKPIAGKFWEDNLMLYGGVQDNISTQFNKNWQSWPDGDIVYSKKVKTKENDLQNVDIKLQSGLYKIKATTRDKFGNEARALLPVMVTPNWSDEKFNIKLPFITLVNNTSIEVGKDLTVLWGTGYKHGRCLMEVELEGNIIERFWTDCSATQHILSIPVTEQYRGGFTVYLTSIRENRAYLHTHFINVPWDNKELDISIESFRDKIEPGNNEIISLNISRKKKLPEIMELLATMYDFSLDQFAKHSWARFNFFKRNYPLMRSAFINGAQILHTWKAGWNPVCRYPSLNYMHFPIEITTDYLYYRFPVHDPTGGAGIKYGDKVEFKGNYGKIIGTVRDAETNERIIGADVYIQGTEYGAATDADGNFEISNITPGTYTVVAAYVGYNEVAMTYVKSIKGKITTLSFRLPPTEIIVSAVTCVATRPEIVISETSTGRAVTSYEMERLPITTVNQVIALQSGIERDKIEERGVDLRSIKIRRDLSETVFFHPNLLTDENGNIKIQFTAPEALTKWKFMGFAHGKTCESGFTTSYTVTQKDIMVQPNPPRFLREGDRLFFTTKIVNMSDKTQEGRVQINFKDLITEQDMNSSLGVIDYVKEFRIKSHISETFSWLLHVQKGMNPLSYTVVAKTDKTSDGETGAMPVLTSRIFLTESFPMHVRGPQKRIFSFDRLQLIEESETIEPFRITVQMVSNPSWYAIQALPVLMEFSYECSERIFNRLYANSLGKHIIDSNPRIQDVFKQWQSSDVLQSNLEKNEFLKSVVITETPWVRQAESETKQKHNTGMLFKENTLLANIASAHTKLEKMQLPDGRWPWFPGGRPDPYITLYIVTGFGRLRKMGVDIDMTMAFRAVYSLDSWLKEIYDKLKNKDANNLSNTIALYLYGRSFYLDKKPISPEKVEVVEYFIEQAEKYWLGIDSRMSQAHLALALNRFGFSESARGIMASIKERSVQDEELGMYWCEDERSWWWYRAPIETQALIVEAFQEVMDDSTSVENCKVWLLKQKQTQHWRTTKATADAVYALLLRGVDFLSSSELVKTRIGDIDIVPVDIEAGTGFYEKSFYKDEIKPEFKEIKLTKKDAGIAWGGVYFQYFEEMSAIKPYTTNLNLEKKIFVKRNTKKGVIIEPVTKSLSVGDLITIRIILRVDRDMEYVHLKDLRGSGLEPVNVLSGYRYQDGLRYYQSSKDVATHFFISYLPKGTYVFEYDLRVQHKGLYQSGIAEIQCMYAPEFNSHSESIWLDIE